LTGCRALYSECLQLRGVVGEGTCECWCWS